jgi:predicted RNase H-like HicB family nuclease
LCLGIVALSAIIVVHGDRITEQIVNLHVEKLPEGVYLATSDDVPGLVAQGRTITETLEIARDVARKLLEARSERSGSSSLPVAADSFDYPLIVAG